MVTVNGVCQREEIHIAGPPFDDSVEDECGPPEDHDAERFAPFLFEPLPEGSEGPLDIEFTLCTHLRLCLL